MADTDDVGGEPKREWFAGRAQEIHQELHADFTRYTREIYPGRMRDLLTEYRRRRGEDPGTKAMVAAMTTATAEGVLTAVAIYLARREADPSVGH